MAISQMLNLQAVRVPPLFRCPISLELMRDPVTLSTGLTYDRSSIETWFEEGHRTCPGTMQLVKTNELVPNHTLRRLIQEWCVANKSKGFERIPTPKQPLDPEQAKQMLHQISEADGNSKIRSRVLKSLRTFAKDSEKNRKCIAAAGATRVLSNLIGPFRISGEKSSLDELECCEDAIAVLSMLSFEEESVKKSVINSSLVRVLSWMLNRWNIEGRVYTARLLESLSIDEESKALIGGTEHIISGLVKLLKEDSYPRALKASLTALLSVASCKKNWMAAVEAGSIPPLIEMLPEANRHNTERALGILELLAKCAEGRAALMEHQLCVPMLVRIILTVSDVASERAVGVLWTMCQADRSIVQVAAQEGAFTQMVLLIQADNTSRTNQRARELLKQLRSVAPQECLHDFAFTMPF